MKKAFAYALAALAVATCFVVNWRLSARRHARDVAERREAFAKMEVYTDGCSRYVSLPSAVSVRENAMYLGRDLFSHARLGREKRSCLTCHPRDFGGTDGLVHGGTATLPVENLAFQRVFGRDGASTNLHDLVRRMVLGKDYLAFPPKWDLRRRLGGGLGLDARFTAAYGSNWSTNEIVDAIAEYARSLISIRTAFDHYWFGDGHPDALGVAEKRGFDAFKDANCIRCHSGPALGGERAEKGSKVTALRGFSHRPIAERGADAVREKAVTMPGAPRSDAKRADLAAFLLCL